MNRFKYDPTVEHYWEYDAPGSDWVRPMCDPNTARLVDHFHTMRIDPTRPAPTKCNACVEALAALGVAP